MKNRPHRIEGKIVDPKRAIPKDATQEEWNFTTKRMYVSGIRDSHTEEMFREYFTKFGSVEQVNFPFIYTASIFLTFAATKGEYLKKGF